MVKQYRHTISYNESAGNNPHLDESGNWATDAGTQTPSVTECRAEMNGVGRTITVADGSKVVYSFTVYMPKTGDRFHPGQPVTISDGTNVLFAGDVLQFKQGALNRVLYV